MKVIKSETYKVGICGVRAILEDKQKAIAFEKGETISVTKEQLDTLKTLDWGVEVKGNDSNTKNTE